jgi:hypothetical protein
MSVMTMDILEMLEQGEHPTKIAMLVDIPLSWVYEVLEQQEEAENYCPFETCNS